jgi:hypothetical protein
MEPLIELSEAAKARIKTKEAKAAEQLDIVRRACDGDIANAHRTWGGYIDIHRDDLQNAIDEADRILEEAATICARFVFTAHATEYSVASRHPGELKPVLSRVREAVIGEYGEHTRASIQFLEAAEIEKSECGSVGDRPLDIAIAGQRNQPGDPSFANPLSDADPRHSSGSYLVTVVRNAGTPTETRREIPMSNPIDQKVRFNPENRVSPGEEIHNERFSEPCVVARIRPIAATNGTLSHWEAEIMSRSEWNRLDGPKQLRRFGEFNPPVLAAFQPRPEYPKNLYHATLEPVTANNPDEDASARAHGYGDVYVPKRYPKWMYHWNREPVVVNSLGEEKTLGLGWTDTPAAFDPYKGSRPARTEKHDPTKWLSEWSVPCLLPDHRKKIKAQLLKADAAFERSPNSDSGAVAAMQQAFEGIAQVLFDSGTLTESLLVEDIPLLVWDAAIAGGWWRLASEAHQDIFPEKVGHYWVWLEERGEWRAPFRAETAGWRAKLIEAPAPNSSIAEQIFVRTPVGEGKSIGDSGAFPERAVWLSREMKARQNMTPYGLHKAGGPDPKTVRKILDGEQVREAQLDLVVAGLSHKGPEVSRNEMPNR